MSDWIKARKQRALLNDDNLVAASLIRLWFPDGFSHRKLAEKLNECGWKTPRGKAHSISSVQRIIKLYEITT